MTERATLQTDRFTTHDLMVLATLACLGAVMSVVLGQIGAALRAAVGMPGITQALAGLHVLWLALAALLVPKQGAATGAGMLKGIIELLLGSPHGFFVVLVSVVAGGLLDLVLGCSPQAYKKWGLIIGAAVAAGSNVVLFQCIIRLPSHGLVLGALVGFTVVATVSGALTGGLLSLALLRPLRHAGIIRRTLLDSPL